MRQSGTAWAGFFAGWFALSVLGQKLWRATGSRSTWDRLHLIIPDWRFFAPDPGVYDHHVLVRVIDDGGSPSSWQEISEADERRLRHAVWHPEQRKAKAAFDVCAELFRHIERLRAENVDPSELGRRVQMSVAYLTLLSYASARVSALRPSLAGDGGQVQFMIAISGGYDDEQPEIVFVSEQHPLQTRDREGGAAGEQDHRT